MKVSICIPAYENKDGIKRLLDSILIQEFEDYEVIITDDSKSSDIKEIASEFIKLGIKNLKYYHNEKRLGPSKNWNHSINLANGRYIKIMHHDDWFSSKDSLYEFVKMLDDNNEAVLAFSGTNQVNVSTNDFYSRCISDEDAKGILDDYRYLFIRHAIGAPSATIFRKSAIRFEEKLSWLMDVEFYMKLLKDGNNKFSYTKEPLISIGISDTQLTESVRDDKALNIFEYGFIYNEFCLREDKRFRDKLIEVCLDFNGEYDLLKDYDIPKEEYKALKDKRRKSDSKALLGLIKEKVLKTDFSYIGKISFYLGVIFEVLIMLVDKSAFVNPVEGWCFRITFALFLIKCALTKYDKREIIAFGLLGLIAIVSYFTNTKDEAVRIVIFIAAMKNIDLKRVLKLVLKIEAAGIFILMLLSLTGVLGTVFDMGGGYGVKEGAIRVCLGLGSANTLAIMLWALMTLYIYLYHDRMKLLHYFLFAIMSVVIYILTYTRTTLALMLLTLVLAYTLGNIKALQRSKVVYSLGALSVLAYLGFSIWAAKVSDWHLNMTPFENKIDDILTGRIESIYPFLNGGGVLENWLPFSKPEFSEYFDMGYVRLFFWYGIIPGAVAIIVLLLMIREAYRRNDYMGFMMIMVFSLLTLIEAHIVSVYIARNYLLFLAGSYMSGMVYLTGNSYKKYVDK